MSSSNQSSNQNSQSAYGSSQNYENRQAPTTSSQWSKPDVSYMNSAPTTSISSQNYENRQAPTTSSQWSKPYMP